MAPKGYVTSLALQPIILLGVPATDAARDAYEIFFNGKKAVIEQMQDYPASSVLDNIVGTAYAGEKRNVNRTAKAQGNTVQNSVFNLDSIISKEQREQINNLTAEGKYAEVLKFEYVIDSLRQNANILRNEDRFEASQVIKVIGMSSRRLENNLDKARDLYEFATELDPRNPYALLNLGSLYRRLGNITNNIEYREKERRIYEQLLTLPNATSDRIALPNVPIHGNAEERKDTHGEALFRINQLKPHLTN